MWLISLTISFCFGVRTPIVASIVDLIRLRNFCKSSSLSIWTYAFSRRILLCLGYRHRSKKLAKKLENLSLSIRLKFFAMFWAIIFLYGSSGLYANFSTKAAFLEFELSEALLFYVSEGKYRTNFEPIVILKTYTWYAWIMISTRRVSPSYRPPQSPSQSKKLSVFLLIYLSSEFKLN